MINKWLQRWDDYGIRRMQYNDLQEIMVIENTLFSSPWTEEMFLTELQEHDAFVLVDCNSGEIICFLCGWLVLDEYMITNVGTAQSHQRQGFMRIFMQWLMEWLPQFDIQVVYLEARRSNLPAQKLYEQVGFNVIGIRKNYYHDPDEDAFIMSFHLQEAIDGIA